MTTSFLWRFAIKSFKSNFEISFCCVLIYTSSLWILAQSENSAFLSISHLCQIISSFSFLFWKKYIYKDEMGFKSLNFMAVSPFRESDENILLKKNSKNICCSLNNASFNTFCLLIGPLFEPDSVKSDILQFWSKINAKTILSDL